VGAASEDPLSRPVYVGDRYEPFGTMTLQDVRGRAAELSAASGWGPTARVGAVARAWSDLGHAMEQAGAKVVADLGAEAASEFARRTWVVPPGGSLL
jgi:hypothetical protein